MKIRTSYIVHLCRTVGIFLLFFYAAEAHAQFNSASTTNRCSLTVEKMMDMGFVNGQQKFESGTHTTYRDLLDSTKTPEYKFRIRTNENFRLSINTYSPNDSSEDHQEVDSLLQVKITDDEDDKRKKNEAGTGFEDINSKPRTVYHNKNDTDDKTFNVKYRAKPGTKLPEHMDEVDLMYTASHP